MYPEVDFSVINLKCLHPVPRSWFRIYRLDLQQLPDTGTTNKFDSVILYLLRDQKILALSAQNGYKIIDTIS